MLKIHPCNEQKKTVFHFTEGRLHSDGRRILRLLTEAKDVHSLDSEHIGLSWDQAMDHKPEAHS